MKHLADVYRSRPSATSLRDWPANPARAMTGEDAVRESLVALREKLRLEVLREQGHYSISVSGADAPEAVEHIGRFLVGAIAQAVRTDLVLQPVLLSEGLDGQQELLRDVEKIVGSDDEPLSTHERTHGRDPWIGEALGQLMLVLSTEAPHPCVPAPMVAAHLPHVEAREHGLDLFGFACPEFTVVVGEAKTSKENIASLLASAEATLSDIEGGVRDNHLRQAVNGLQLSLPVDLRRQVVGSVWKRSRSYLPVLCFEAGIRAEEERAVLKDLVEQGADCRLIVFQHADHDSFFDAVARAMLSAVAIISPA